MNGMVFSTFDWDQLGKILQHIKLNSKVINSESDLLKTNEDIAPQRREIYRHLHGGSGGRGGGGGGGGEGRGGGLHGKFMPTIIPPSYGLFAESRRVCSLQNYFGSNWCETTHFFRQGMNSSQQVIAKLGHVVQTDVFCLP